MEEFPDNHLAVQNSNINGKLFRIGCPKHMGSSGNLVISPKAHVLRFLLTKKHPNSEIYAVLQLEQNLKIFADFGAFLTV